MYAREFFFHMSICTSLLYVDFVVFFSVLYFCVLILFLSRDGTYNSVDVTRTVVRECVRARFLSLSRTLTREKGVWMDCVCIVHCILYEPTYEFAIIMIALIMMLDSGFKWHIHTHAFAAANNDNNNISMREKNNEIEVKLNFFFLCHCFGWYTNGPTHTHTQRERAREWKRKRLSPIYRFGSCLLLKFFFVRLHTLKYVMYGMNMGNETIKNWTIFFSWLVMVMMETQDGI